MPPRRLPLLLGGFVGGLVATLVAAALHEPPPAPAITFGAADVAAGERRVDDVRPFTERVVEARVPFAYTGAEPTRLLLTLLVADDAAFDAPVGIGHRELALSDVEDEGVARVTARVRGGGLLHWSVTAVVLEGTVPAPSAQEGTVVFRER